MSDGSETTAPLDTALGPILKKILDARGDTTEEDATKTTNADELEEEAAEALRAYMGPGLQQPATDTPEHITRARHRAQTGT